MSGVCGWGGWGVDSWVDGWGVWEYGSMDGCGWGKVEEREGRIRMTRE